MTCCFIFLLAILLGFMCFLKSAIYISKVSIHFSRSVVRILWFKLSEALVVTQFILSYRNFQYIGAVDAINPSHRFQVHTDYVYLVNIF